MTSVTGAPDFLSTISAHQTILVIGAFLMLLNTAVDVGKGVLFFPILEKHGKRTALGYLAAMIVEVVLLDVGVLALLMIVPLGSRHGIGAGVAKRSGRSRSSRTPWPIRSREMSLAVGCIFLCVLLFRTRLVPRWLSISGLIGYPVLMVGAIAEIFGIHIGAHAHDPRYVLRTGAAVLALQQGFPARRLPRAAGDGSVGMTLSIPEQAMVTSPRGAGVEGDARSGMLDGCSGSIAGKRS